jgi:RNA polymerase sigma factor (sigma-70 family)
MYPEFDEFYRECHGDVVSSLALVCGSLHDAQEATDEAFVRCLVRWERVRRMDSSSGWVYRVALNALRKSQRRGGRLRSSHLEDVPEHSRVPVHMVESWEILEPLAPRQRTAVVLRVLADLPEKEVARAMGISRGTVSSTLHDAYERLAAHADESQPEEREGNRV